MRKASTSGETRSSSIFWFVAKEKVLKGPYTLEQILSELAEGNLEPGDYCWRQGFQEWRPLCSVEDFGFQVKPYVVRAYPEVAVPSARASSDAPGAKSSPTAQSHRSQVMAQSATHAKTVKVRLERQQHSPMGVWERAGMILFAVIFAWGACWVALSEVEESFSSLYERSVAGELLPLGEVPHVMEGPAWDFYQLAPVLSAPGLAEQEDQEWLVRGLVARRLYQRPLDPATETAGWSFSTGHQAEWNSPHSGEVSFRYPADPVYIQTYDVTGRWSPLKPSVVKTRTSGYPGF